MLKKGKIFGFRVTYKSYHCNLKNNKNLGGTKENNFYYEKHEPYS